MSLETTSLDTLRDIRAMMEKSSRFISLSGWSGVAAGVCGLAGAFFAHQILGGGGADYQRGALNTVAEEELRHALLLLAAGVFACAFVTAFIFTYLRSRREGIAIWGATAKRLLFNTMLPMIAGGVLILKLVMIESYELIAPCTLIFYGLALLNGSKYTLGEIKYLGYIEITLGAISLWYPDQWLLFWTVGFGIMHIVYGIVMWQRYER